jgi:hypothetical protein
MEETLRRQQRSYNRNPSRAGLVLAHLVNTLPLSPLPGKYGKDGPMSLLIRFNFPQPRYKLMAQSHSSAIEALTLVAGEANYSPTP